MTHAPNPSSPAVPGSGGTACDAGDQRGYARPVDGDGNGSLRCDIGALEVGSATLVYTYDKLYRLTNANYGAAGVFTYTYDAVGNRLTQTTLTSTITYTYDIANRLINVGGITQTWDNNGNLLSDGVLTYTYDSANRLSTLKQGTSLTYTYSYNGLGDRQRASTCGGVCVPAVTNYVLDLNAGLTQVLAEDVVEGTPRTYLYGNGRIAQQTASSTDYFLGDALGSVRQLASVTGTVTLAKSYQPFGSVLSSAGTGASSYGFTGEWTDATNLIYLRARYYAPYLNQWIQPDTIVPQYDDPRTLNRYVYVNDNPINYTDPSGKVACLPSSAGDRLECQPPRTDRYNRKTPPRNITWNPAVELLPITIRDYLGNKVAPGTPQSQFRITDPLGNEVTGACGALTVAAIVQQTEPNITGNRVFLNAYNLKYETVWEGKTVQVPVTPNYTGYLEVEAIIRAYEGWDAYTITHIADEDAANQLRSALASHKYPIPGVSIGGITGRVGAGSAGHWLAVTGLSQEWYRGKEWQWVRVYNPFDNGPEYYWWQDFFDAWPGTGWNNRLMVVANRSAQWRLGGP